MTHRPVFPSAWALLAALLLVAACQPGAEEAARAGGPDPAGQPETAAAPKPPDSAAATTDDPLAGTDATALVERAPSADLVPAGFDARAVAGTFSGRLPCADCPGIDAILELHADGRYSLEERYRGRDTVLDSEGTWMPQPDGGSLLLDPNDKDRDDRRFALLSNDALRLLDRDGAPVGSGPAGSLRRRD